MLLGPTGTGKTELAVSVARRIGAEIIGCDALQIYREFDIATAKPCAEDRRRVPHHLVDALDPRTDVNMAGYVEAADRCIAEIHGRGAVPMVVGGTGMYLRGLLRGVVRTPPRNREIRERLRRVERRRGAGSLHRWLARRDPESAGRIAPADTQRVVRALELALSGGPTWSQRLDKEGSWNRARERYAALKIGLDMDRQLLRAGLDRRVDRFFEEGLVAEVRSLLERGIPPEANAFKAIGYRELLAVPEAARETLAVREEVKRSTRRYAKRQRTWFRREPGVHWLDAARATSELTEIVVERWLRFTRGSGMDPAAGSV